jgi:hypothetical protein
VATVGITVETPCGPKTVSVPLPFNLPPLPAFPPPGFPPPFPPKLPFPLPDCSFVDHIGSAPEPPEDSEPDP